MLATNGKLLAEHGVCGRTPGFGSLMKLVDVLDRFGESTAAAPIAATTSAIRHIVDRERSCIQRLLRPSPPDRPAVRHLLERYEAATAAIERALRTVEDSNGAEGARAVRRAIVALYTEAHDPLVERVARRFGVYWLEYVARESEQLERQDRAA